MGHIINELPHNGNGLGNFTFNVLRSEVNMEYCLCFSLNAAEAPDGGPLASQVGFGGQS
jgi:hypothetical protein